MREAIDVVERLDFRLQQLDSVQIGGRHGLGGELLGADFLDDLSGGQVGPLALPGNYTARVSYKSDTATQVITVLRDPYSAAADADMAAQFAETRAIHDDMNTDVESYPSRDVPVFPAAGA